MSRVFNRAEDSPAKWVCFLPYFVFKWGFIKKRFVLNNLDMDIHIMPKTVLTLPPNELKQFFDEQVASMQDEYAGQKDVNILGISLGNILALRLAELVSVNKLVSVVPASRFPEAFYESIATRNIITGRPIEEYREALSDYQPLEAAKNINPGHTEVHIGRWDLMVPYKYGKELADALSKRLPVDTVVYPRHGHVGAMFAFAKRFPQIAGLPPK